MRPRSPRRLRRSRQLMSTGVLCRKASSSICLMRKFATSAREMNPHAQSRRSTNRAMGVLLGPPVKDQGTHDPPSEFAPTDNAFLHVLVVIEPPQHEMKRRVIKQPAVAAAVARAEARHADQPLNLSLLHCGDEHSRRFGEKSRRLEDDFWPGRNAERLDDDIDSAQRALHRGHLKGVA